MKRAWKRFRAWLKTLDSHYGKIQCDICGKWGTPNPNYLVPTFVHISYYGTAYMHPEHIVRHIIKKYRQERGA